MTTANPKKPKRGRPENPKYQEPVHIDASPKDVARAIMRKPVALPQGQAPLTGWVG